MIGGLPPLGPAELSVFAPTHSHAPVWLIIRCRIRSGENPTGRLIHVHGGLIADFAWLWIPGIESDKSKQTIQICVLVRDA
jgi:hypothetical protein